MIRTEGGRVEIKGDYADLISDFGCIARLIGSMMSRTIGTGQRIVMR